MNTKSLGIYLDDHSAIMQGELELIARCCRSQQAGPLREFLGQLEREVIAQQTIVKDVKTRIGIHSRWEGQLKSGAAWIAEKVGRLKLNGSLLSYSPLSRVVELESLSVAACERVALWNTLDALADADSRLDGITFTFFQEQAENHLATLASYRRAAAMEAFLTTDA